MYLHLAIILRREKIKRAKELRKKKKVFVNLNNVFVKNKVVKYDV